jgi:hypothetical protein
MKFEEQTFLGVGTMALVILPWRPVAVGNELQHDRKTKPWHERYFSPMKSRRGEL